MTRARAALLGAALFFAAPAHAQTRTPAVAPPPAAEGATADEDFELDITQRRITESDFSAATAVEAGGGPGGLDLRVGATVRAAEIDVLLRNVRGRVRFRASLETVLRLLDARRHASPAPPPPQ